MEPPGRLFANLDCIPIVVEELAYRWFFHCRQQQIAGHGLGHGLGHETPHAFDATQVA